MKRRSRAAARPWRLQVRPANGNLHRVSAPAWCFQTRREGTANSNSKSLEQKGWRGVCIDAFPRKMEGRTCQAFKEVVFSEAGKRVTFRVPGHLDLGGIVDTLGRWKRQRPRPA